MAPKPRKPRSKDLPENLYEMRPGYFRYLNPLTDDWITVGRIPRRDAISQALEANLHLSDQLAAPRLIDVITRDDKHSASAWIDRFEKDIVPKRDLAAVTLRLVKYHGRLVKVSPLGAMIIDRVDIIHIADFLKTYTDRGKHRMALALWSYLKDLFAEAIGAGWIRSKINPVVHTSTPSARVMRARLKLEEFWKIYEVAGGREFDPWAQNAFQLAMVSAQRREDLAVVEFKQRDKVKAWTADNMLWVTQHKTKARLRIPFGLRLDAVGWSLEEVVARCRDNVVSPFLLHHTVKRTHAKAGSAIHVSTLSRIFSKARDLAGLTWPAVDELGNPQTPPTFHEIRSLSARLYEAQGNVDVQILLGHRDPKTTAVYKDSRGTEWQEVKIA